MCLRVCLSQDLLGTDWAACSAPGPADVTAAVSTCALRASSVAHREPEKIRLQQTGASSGALCNGMSSRNSTHTAAGQTVALGLRQLSCSPLSSSLAPPTLNNSQSNLASQQGHVNTLKASVAQDDFDDWDVDLADLDKCDSQMPTLPVPTVEPFSSAKTLRPSTCRGIPKPPELNTGSRTSGLSSHNLPPGTHLQSPNIRHAVPLVRPQSSSIFPGLTATSPALSPFGRTLNMPQQPQNPWATPRPSTQARSLFDTVSPAASPSMSSSTLSPHPLHTPVLTNRLVQLVSASSKPKKRPFPEPRCPRTRRFPGPAGLLPQQVSLILCCRASELPSAACFIFLICECRGRSSA